MKKFSIVIDTSNQLGIVAILDNLKLLSIKKNELQNKHAEFAHIAIQELLKELEINFNQIEKIIFINGPGSYTGLRVGLSLAKGLCYAAQIPLYTVGSLAVLAQVVIDDKQPLENDIIIPMIDARRNEVYAGVFNGNGVELKKPFAEIISEYSFSEFKDRKIYFVGNANHKVENLDLLKCLVKINHENYTKSLVKSIQKADLIEGPVNLFYVEPQYVKNVYTTKSNKKEI